jgi:hypothetical protein
MTNFSSPAALIAVRSLITAPKVDDKTQLIDNRITTVIIIEGPACIRLDTHTINTQMNQLVMLTVFANYSKLQCSVLLSAEYAQLRSLRQPIYRFWY